MSPSLYVAPAPIRFTVLGPDTNTPLSPTLNAPLTAIVSCRVHTPPASGASNVMLLKEPSAPQVIVFPAKVPLNITVPVPGINVSSLDQLPPTVTDLAMGATVARVIFTSYGARSPLVHSIGVLRSFISAMELTFAFVPIESYSSAVSEVFHITVEPSIVAETPYILLESIKNAASLLLTESIEMDGLVAKPNS